MISPRPRSIECQSGLVTLEAALVLPLLILITLGLTGLGSIMFIQNNMLHAARETARSLAVGDTTLGEAHDTAANHLLNWEEVNFTVTPTEPNASDVSVEITTPLSEAALVDVLGIFSSGTLRARVTMKKEIG